MSEQRWNNIPTITPEELKNILNILKNMNNPPALMVYGPPGVGKTQILKRFANENNYDLRVKHLSRMDPSDWSGIPQTDKGYTTFLPPYFFREPEKDNDGNDKRIVVFFDELNTALPQVLNAALDVLLEKKLDNKKLPENTIMVAAGNLGIEDGTYVEELSTAVKTRLLQFVLKQDTIEWTEWASNNGLLSYIINFIEEHPHYLIDMHGMQNREQQVATPRGWETISNIVKHSNDNKWYKNKIIGDMIYGAVGEKVARVFIKYVLNMIDSLNDANVREVKALVSKSLEEVGIDRILYKFATIADITDKLLKTGDDSVAKMFVENILQNMDRAEITKQFYGKNYEYLYEFLKRNYPEIIKKVL